MNHSFSLLNLFTLMCLFYSYKIPNRTITWALGLLGSCFFGPLLVLNGVFFLVDSNYISLLVLILLVIHIIFIYSRYKKMGSYNWLSLFLGIPAFYSKPDQILNLTTGPAHFYQASNPEAPCVVIIFGGGFIGGSLGQLALIPNFLKKSGFHAICLPYRHLHVGIWPVPLTDLTEGLKQVLEMTNSNFKPAEFHLLGRSAGGYLALQLSHVFKDESRIKSVISLYPICDIQAWTEEKGSKLILNADQIVEKLFEKAKPLYPDVRHAPQPQFRKFLTISGDFDPYVEARHSQWLYEALSKAGHQVEHRVLPFQSHGFDVSLDSFAGQVLSRELLRFLGRKADET